MSFPIDLAARFDSAGQYLRALHRMRRATWLDAYAIYRGGHLTAPEAYSLVHPSWYSHVIKQDIICGPRIFSREISRSASRCGSRLLWGYDCPCGNSAHADHLFPYSYGGVTDARNLVLLCETHNRLKHEDIHIYPWERGLATWVEEAIERIRDAAALLL